jgi:hypothetical protein
MINCSKSKVGIVVISIIMTQLSTLAQSPISPNKIDSTRIRALVLKDTGMWQNYILNSCWIDFYDECKVIGTTFCRKDLFGDTSTARSNINRVNHYRYITYYCDSQFQLLDKYIESDRPQYFKISSEIRKKKSLQLKHKVSSNLQKESRLLWFRSLKCTNLFTDSFLVNSLQ